MAKTSIRGEHSHSISMCLAPPEPKGRIATAAALWALFLALAAGCSSPQANRSETRSDLERREESSGDAPIRYRLPVAPDSVGRVYVGLENRVVVVEEERYRALSLKDTPPGGSASELKRGNWSQARSELEFDADPPPEEVVKFAAAARAAGVVLEEGQFFQKEIGYGGKRQCWRIEPGNDVWRVRRIEDVARCTNRWLYTVTQREERGSTYRFESYHGREIEYEGDIGLANQTWLLNWSRVFHCSLQPRVMYGSEKIPDDRKLVDDLTCKSRDRSVAFPVEGYRFLDFGEGFDGSLAAVVAADDGQVFLYVLE